MSKIPKPTLSINFGFLVFCCFFFLAAQRACGCSQPGGLNCATAVNQAAAAITPDPYPTAPEQNSSFYLFYSTQI